MDDKSIPDEFDKSLLSLLQENSRMKNTDLAKRLNVTEGAIRKRIARLLKLGIIEKFTIQLSDKSQGVRAIVEVTIEGTEQPSNIRKRIFEIADMREWIEVIYELTGDVDMIVIFHTMDHDALHTAIENLRQVEGIEKTKTLVVLKRTKIANLIL